MFTGQIECVKTFKAEVEGETKFCKMENVIAAMVQLIHLKGVTHHKINI